jgi:DNA topoisomerase 2-associated protein PAT1
VPEEEAEVDIPAEDDEDEDLSYAAMFSAGLDLATAGGGSLWDDALLSSTHVPPPPQFDLASLGALAPAAPLGYSGGYAPPPPPQAVWGAAPAPPRGAAVSAAALEAALFAGSSPAEPVATSAAALEARLLAGAAPARAAAPPQTHLSYAAAATPPGGAPPQPPQMLVRPPGPPHPFGGRGLPRPPLPGAPPGRGWPAAPPPGRGWPPGPGRGPAPGRGFPGVRGGFPGRGGPARPRVRGSAAMSGDEIEAILRIQWRSLHTGPPYVEDFYAQAVAEKATGGANARSFAPAALRELAPSEKGVADLPSFARLDGLGKIPFSNVRRPKPLMDLGLAGEAVKSGEGDAAAPATPAAADAKTAARLDADPRLAARVVVEEAACLLLDVDDIDRVWAAAGGSRPDEGALRQRRAILMEALCRALRLPDAPAADRARDGVFLRLAALHKGRAVLGRGLRLLLAPLAAPGPGAAGIKASRPLKLVWALLRCGDDLFAEKEEVVGEGSNARAAAADAAREAAVTAAAAAAATDAVRRLRSPEEARDAMAALAGGSLAARARSAATPADALLPLLPPGAGSPGFVPRPWLIDVLLALFARAAELGLAPGAPPPPPPGTDPPPPPSDAVRASWGTACSSFLDLLVGHVGTLADVARLARDAGADGVDAITYARAVAPGALVTAALPFAGDVAAGALRKRMAELEAA